MVPAGARSGQPREPRLRSVGQPLPCKSSLGRQRGKKSRRGGQVANAPSCRPPRPRPRTACRRRQPSGRRAAGRPPPRRASSGRQRPKRRPSPGTTWARKGRRRQGPWRPGRRCRREVRCGGRKVATGMRVSLLTCGLAPIAPREAHAGGTRTDALGHGGPRRIRRVEGGLEGGRVGVGGRGGKRAFGPLLLAACPPPSRIIAAPARVSLPAA